MLAKLTIFRFPSALDSFASQYFANSVATTRLAVVFRRIILSVASRGNSVDGPALCIPAQFTKIEGLCALQAYWLLGKLFSRVHEEDCYLLDNLRQILEIE